MRSIPKATGPSPMSIRREPQETDNEAEVAEALFDLANMFEKAETVLEGEEVGASKRSLRARGKHSQAAGASHRAAAAASQHRRDDGPQANGRGGYGRYRRDAEAAARPSQAAAETGGALPQQPAPSGYDGSGGGLRNGEALPRDIANPWDPRHLQSLGLLPGGKANGLLGLSGFPPQLPAGLAGFYPPPSPATAAAQLAAWPSTFPFCSLATPGSCATCVVCTLVVDRQLVSVFCRRCHHAAQCPPLHHGC